MKKIRNINLEFSCPENRSSMNKVGSNYFCENCSSKVVDFTEKSESEFQKIIESTTKPVCGIYKRSQLSDQFLKYAAATFIATTSIVFQANSQEIIKVDSAKQACEYLEEEEVEGEFFGMIVEKQAQPIGGYKKFFEELAKELEFPPELREKGKSFVQFALDTTGQMTEIKVIKGFNEESDKEAIRALKELNYPFFPAEQRGKPVKTRMVIPITFDPEK